MLHQGYLNLVHLNSSKQFCTGKGKSFWYCAFMFPPFLFRANQQTKPACKYDPAKNDHMYGKYIHRYSLFDTSNTS